MSFNKQQAVEALSKGLNMTDEELVEMQNIPETFWPKHEDNLTVDSLHAEQVRRKAERTPSDSELVQAAIDCIQLQMMINLGHGLYPILDKIGRFYLREELKRREAYFNEKFQYWSNR